MGQFDTSRQVLASVAYYVYSTIDRVSQKIRPSSFFKALTLLNPNAITQLITSKSLTQKL